MKNIYTILETIGIQIPADKKSDFDTAFNENYKTISEVKTFLMGKLLTAL